MDEHKISACKSSARSVSTKDTFVVTLGHALLFFCDFHKPAWTDLMATLDAFQASIMKQKVLDT